MIVQPCYQIYLSTDDIPREWDGFGVNIFLNTTYLKAQEEALPQNMQVFYVAYFWENQMIAKSIFQRVTINKNQILKGDKTLLYHTLGGVLNHNLLCVGNIKLTGQNAFEFISPFNFKRLSFTIHKAIDAVKKMSAESGNRIQLVLFKDYYKPKAEEIKASLKGYSMFSVQPNMVLPIRSHWHQFKDYLADMRTKYRTRAKRAFKKNEVVVYKELNSEEILAQQDKIYALYLNVYHNVDFSAYQLPRNYFYIMKKYLQKDFKFFAGYVDNEAVCFYSLIHNGPVLETGFLGYSLVLQQTMQLYLNMLYKIIAYGINHQFKSIILSRSALEIKSSVGAEAVSSYGFLKHQNSILNVALKVLFHQFYQPKEWTPRSPFKN